jgi:hypothetical protein
MSDLPANENFCSPLDTRMSRRRVAQLYRARGWGVRKCAWYDYEITCPWAELTIEAQSPIFIHGSVADVLERADELLAPLQAASVDYVAECYDADGTMLREWKSKP